MNKIALIILFPLSLWCMELKKFPNHIFKPQRYHVIWPIPVTADEDNDIYQQSRTLFEQEIQFSILDNRCDSLKEVVVPFYDSCFEETEREARIQDTDELLSDSKKIKNSLINLELLTQQEEKKYLRKQTFDHIDTLKNRLLKENGVFLTHIKNRLESLEKILSDKIIPLTITNLKNDAQKQTTIFDESIQSTDTILEKMELFLNKFSAENVYAHDSDFTVVFQFFKQTDEQTEKIPNIIKQFDKQKERIKNMSRLYAYLNNNESSCIQLLQTNVSLLQVGLEILKNNILKITNNLNDFTEGMLLILPKLISEKKYKISHSLSNIKFIAGNFLIQNSLVLCNRYQTFFAVLEKIKFIKQNLKNMIVNEKNELSKFEHYIKIAQKVILEKRSAIQNGSQPETSTISLVNPCLGAIPYTVIMSEALERYLKKFPIFHCKKYINQEQKLFNDDNISALYLLSTGEKKLKKDNLEKKNSKKSLTETNKVNIVLESSGKCFEATFDMKNSNCMLCTNRLGQPYFIEFQKDSNNAYELNHIISITAKSDSSAEKSFESQIKP